MTKDNTDDLMAAMLADQGHRQTFNDIEIGGGDVTYTRPQATMDFTPVQQPFDFDPKLYPLKGTFKEHQARGLAEADFKPGHCYFLDPGAGKCQPLTAQVLTADGWASMGDIKKGDFVYTRSGSLTQVVGVYPKGFKPAFRLTFSDQSSTICCDEHLWMSAAYFEAGRYKVRSLRDMLDIGLTRPSGKAKFSIPIADPIQFEVSDLPIEPYLLGALIGDGSLTCSPISLSAPPEKEFVTRKAGAMTPEGVFVHYFDYGATPGFRFTADGHSNPLNVALRELGLHGVLSPYRFIPEVYLFASIDQRTDMLHGLMDTDGSCTDNRVRFSTMSIRLAEGVVDLVRSLGGTARIQAPSKRDGEIAVSIKMNTCPFSDPRKAQSWQRPTFGNGPKRKLIRADYIGLREMQCIAVQDESHLYITDDYIVTHNTAMVIGEASGLFVQGKIDGMILLAPNGPHQQMVDEQMPLWCDVPWRGFHNKQGKRDIDKFFGRAAMDTMGVMAMNYDAIIVKSGLDLINRFMEKYPRIYLALDESSKLKSPKAQRTHEATMLARRSPYRRLLSGTPILRGLEDLYSQYDIVEPGLTGHRRFTGFRSYYCVTRPIPGARSRFAQQIVGYRNEEELKRRTAKHTTRVKSVEFRPEANPTFMTVSTPMKPDQAKKYQSMLDLLMVEINGGTITVENALSRMAKLLQIASGYIIDEEGEVQWLSNNKVDAVNDLLDDLDEPVVMFAPFIALQDHLETAMRERDDRHVFRYRGREDVVAWKEKGGVILGNQGSGLGIGQNLQKSAATIYPANNFSAEARWQSIKRTDRTGQDRQCRFWDLVAPNTLEKAVLKSLADKEALANRSIDDIRSYLQ